MVTFLVSGCACFKKKPFNEDFCYLYKDYVVCSEKHGSEYANIDYPLSHLTEMAADPDHKWVMIPVESFESNF